MKTVVLISAIAEWIAVKPLFPDAKIQHFPFGECFEISMQDDQLSFFHSGWGKISSAGSLQYVIDHQAPDLIVNLGTCGGFEVLSIRVILFWWIRHTYMTSWN